MLIQAGVYGNGTVELQTAAPTSSSRSSSFTSVPDDRRPDRAELNAGSIAGITVGIAVLTCIIIGAILLWQRKIQPKNSLSKNPSAEGLEVGDAPAGFGHNVELGSEGQKVEMWTRGNTNELPSSVPLQELSDGVTMPIPSVPRSPGRGQYAAVPRGEPEIEELDGSSRVEEDSAPGKGIKRKPLASEISSSWAGAAWLDLNDPRQVLPGGRTASPDARGD